MESMETSLPIDTPFVLALSVIAAIAFIGVMYGLGAIFAKDSGEDDLID